MDCLWLVSGCHIISDNFYNFFKKQVFPGTNVLDEEYTERERKALFPSEGKGRDDDDELGHLSGDDLFAVLNCTVQLLPGTIETLTSAVCSVHMIIV